MNTITAERKYEPERCLERRQVSDATKQRFDQLVSGGNQAADGERCREHHSDDGLCGNARPIFDAPNEERPQE
jgi:hypothetical protein